MEQQRLPRFTLETVPIKTLLHYTKKEDLMRALPQSVVAGLQREALQSGQKLTAKFLKDAIVGNADLANELRRSQLGQQAFQKYVANYQRITAPDTRAKSRQVRAELAEPRREFLGCVATKVNPRVFKECAEHYDEDPDYKNIALVPSAALKRSVFNKTGSRVMAPKPGTHISDLPRGLRSYIRKHPVEFMDYLDEIKAQAEYLKSVGRGARLDESDEERERAARGKRRVVGEGELECDYCDD